MKCPRCQLGDIQPGATCRTCGYQTPADATPDDVMLRELERVAREELSDVVEIVKVLGRGGMSVVLLARETDLARQVALKVLPLQLSWAPDAAERFKREARIAASLDHPHIVPVHRVGATPRLLWYSMKYVRGATLAAKLEREGPLPLPTVVRFIAKVADALHYAHQRGVVHRDVKPGNFMIDERGWAWVTDFGVAKAFGSVPLTQTGGALGTPGYMSPEQCFGRELDGRADQYALAVVTYECLTGSPPFLAESIGEYVHKHCHEAVPDVRSLRDDVPEHVAQTLTRALAKRPDDRFATAVDFAAALGAPRDSAGLPPVRASDGSRRPVTPTTPTPHASPGPHRRVGHAAAVVAALALIVLFVALPRDDATGPAPPLPADTAAVVPDTTPGRLILSTSPLGLLYIDDVHAGQSYTAQPLPIAPGRHIVRVEVPGFYPRIDTIVVAPGDTVRLVGLPLRSRQ